MIASNHTWGRAASRRCAREAHGCFGVGLLLIGFALQSVQYWVALLDVGIR